MNAHDRSKRQLPRRASSTASTGLLAVAPRSIRSRLMSFCSARQPPSLRISIRLASLISCARAAWVRNPGHCLQPQRQHPEVVEGCEIALAAGATVIAQTDNAGSRLTPASGPRGSTRGARACRRPRSPLAFRCRLRPSCSISRRATPILPICMPVSPRWIRFFPGT